MPGPQFSSSAQFGSSSYSSVQGTPKRIIPVNEAKPQPATTSGGNQ